MGGMAASAAGRTGVLIIRLWIEDPAVPDVRARIIKSMDIATEEPVAESAATLEDIRRKVEDWLQAFIRLQMIH